MLAPTSSNTNIIGRRYQLHSLLGRGGMGAVYRAADRLTGQQVALKRVINPEDTIEFSSSYNLGDFRLALAQEFKLLASLRHPHVIEVLDYGFDGERQPYFTMELLEHAQTVLDAGMGRPLELKISLIAQMLQALTYLHRRGILHRDLKPANVLVINDEVKLLDFGLSVMRDHAHDDSGATAGTLAYMSPEVLIGNSATEASDLYAVGMIAFELLAEKYPFDLLDIGALVNHVLYSVPDFNLLALELPLTIVLQRLLQKEPPDRYSSANEALAALSKAVEQNIPLETVATRESFLQAARLVGREAEIDQLSTALFQASRGHGSTWLVAGESGVGKSRLVDEIRTLAMVEGAIVMRGQSVSEGQLPYQIWRGVFRWIPLLTELEDTDAGLIKLLAPDTVTLSDQHVKEAAELDPQKAQGRLLKVLEAMLQDQKHPVVIFLEDLHWASSESLVLLYQLAQLAQNLPLLIIASYRDDERPDLPSLLPDIPMLKLNRLTEEMIGELSEAMLGEVGRQPQVLNLLQRETEGNVFFLIEVVRALAEEAGQLDQIGKMTLPEHVFAGGMRLIIQRRLQHIPQYAHELLQLAAVIGRQQDLILLRSIGPEIDLNRWLLDCANAAVLDVLDGGWRFAHDKLRDGVLEGLTDEERERMHRRVAEAIELLYGDTERAAALAYHWGMAGDVAKEEHYVALAGEQALRSGAYQEAVSFLERALMLTTRSILGEKDVLIRRIYLQHRQAEAYLGFGGYHQAQRLYSSSLMIAQQLNDVQAVARSNKALGDVAYALNEYVRARDYYKKGLTLYREINDQAGIAQSLNSLGNIAYDLGEQEEAKQLYQQSLAISREIGGQWGMAGSVSKTESTNEDKSAQIKIQEQLLLSLQSQMDADDKHGMANTLFKLGEVAFDLKNYVEARQYFQRCLGLRQEVEDVSGVIQVLNSLGATDLMLSDYEDAMINYRQALSETVTGGFTVLALHTLMGIARLYVADKKNEQALELLAFVLYHPENDAALEDEAERMAFDLESDISSNVVEAAWERGKARSLEEIAGQILAVR